MRRAFREARVDGRLRLAFTDCLGPCSEANVIFLYAHGRPLWLRRINTVEDFDAVLAYAREVADGGPAALPWVPAVDIEETDDAWLVEAEVPGVRKEDVNVEVRGSELSISGEIKERERKGILRRRTRRTGRFDYRVTLPGEADPEGIDASLDDGVLTVRVPKPERTRPRSSATTSRAAVDSGTAAPPPVSPATLRPSANPCRSGRRTRYSSPTSRLSSRYVVAGGSPRSSATSLAVTPAPARAIASRIASALCTAFG